MVLGSQFVYQVLIVTQVIGHLRSLGKRLNALLPSPDLLSSVWVCHEIGFHLVICLFPLLALKGIDFTTGHIFFQGT